MCLTFLSFSAWAVFCHGAPFWNRVCSARKAKQSDDDEEEEDESAAPLEVTAANERGNAPLTSTLASMRPNVVARVLEHHARWYEDLDEVAPDVTGEWAYALMARLEKPLHPDVTSALRTLALAASRQRRRVIQEGEALERINALSLFVCLVAKYFNQGDLAD